MPSASRDGTTMDSRANISLLESKANQSVLGRAPPSTMDGNHSALFTEDSIIQSSILTLEREKEAEEQIKMATGELPPFKGQCSECGRTYTNKQSSKIFIFWSIVFVGSMVNFIFFSFSFQNKFFVVVINFFC